MGFIETPEFWSALAFILVILIAERPLGRALKSWGKRQADSIQNQFDEAQKLVDQAKKLKEQYEKAYTLRGGARQKLMREAETEIRFLETDAMEQSSDRIRRKSQEVEMRLKMIAEHGCHDIKHQMLKRVVQKTKKILVNERDNNPQNENAENLTEDVCRILASFENIVK